MPAALLFRDGFVRANASTLGTNWSDLATGFQVNGNVATANVQAITKYAESVPYGVVLNDCTVVAAETTVGGGSWGIFARGAGTSPGTWNGYAAIIDTATSVKLFRVTGSVGTLLGSATITRTAMTDLRLDLIGTTLQVWYGLTLVITATDSTYTTGFVGMCNGYVSGALSTVNVARFDVRADEIWNFIPNGYLLTPVLHNEVVEYDSGFTQRNVIWQRDRTLLTFTYDYINDTDMETMKSFFLRHRGPAFSFLIQDPRWTATTPTQEFCAVCDGVATAYKAREDKISASVLVYKDGVLDATPSVSLADALVLYTTPPPRGAVLSVTPGSCYYRVRFVDEQLKFQRRPPNYWTATINFVQDKNQYAGVNQ